MTFLLSVSRAIDRVTAVLGKIIGWAIMASILISAGNATTRKLFSLSSNAWLEAQWYLFGLSYMIASAYTLQRNEHIRIDIVSNLLPVRVRDIIDLVGHFVMLLPFCAILVWEMWPSLVRSYAIREMSNNFGGLIVWPAKAFILIGFAILFVQGISEIIKRIAIMRGIITDPYRSAGHHGPAEEGGA